MENGRPAAYITGIGVVSPIGVGRKKFWSSLLANESGAGPITLFDPEGFEVRIAAECTEFDPEDFMDRKLAARTDRFAQMGLACSKLALEDAGAWDELRARPERVGLILGSGIGGVMSRRNDDPEGACRPYDENHNGFLIGEGSAVMVLESAESVRRRGAEPY